MCKIKCHDFGPIVKTMQDHAATLRIDSLEYAKKLTIKPDYVIENNSWRTEDD